MSKFFNLIKDAEQFEQLVKEAQASKLIGTLAKALAKSQAFTSGARTFTKKEIKSILQGAIKSTSTKDKALAKAFRKAQPKDLATAFAKAEMPNANPMQLQARIDAITPIIEAEKQAAKQAVRAAGQLSKLPKEFRPAKGTVIRENMKQGLTLKADPVTGDLSINKMPKSWLDPNGKLTPAGASALAQVEAELIAQRAAIQSARAASAARSAQTAKELAKSQARIRKTENWNAFKASLPATAAKGAGILTGVAGLYAMFSGQPSVPAATPEQSKLISSTVDLSAATQMPSADNTIAATNNLLATLDQFKQGENPNTVSIVNNYYKSLSSIMSALAPLKNLSGLDKNSIGKYISSINSLSAAIDSTLAQSGSFKSALESTLNEKKSPKLIQKINSSGLIEKIENVQSSLEIYKSQIQDYQNG